MPCFKGSLVRHGLLPFGSISDFSYYLTHDSIRSNKISLVFRLFPAEFSQIRIISII